MATANEKVLHYLRNNPDKAASAVASELKLSQPATLKRLRKLEGEDLVTSRVLERRDKKPLLVWSAK